MPLGFIAKGLFLCYNVGRTVVNDVWKQCNPNPNGKLVGDCTVRAISLATNDDWDTTYVGLALQGFMMGDMPSANSVTTAYLRNKGFRRRTIPDDCPDCYTIEDSCNDRPKGTFVVGTGSHLTTVIDGCLWDSWDSRNETPVYYFEKLEDRQCTNLIMAINTPITAHSRLCRTIWHSCE